MLPLLSPLIMAAQVANAQLPRELGIGAIFGEPTGITGKWWRDSRQAVDAGLAYSFGGYMLLYGDYLFHFPNLINQSYVGAAARDLHPYLGVGGLLVISTRENRRDGTFGKDTDVGLGVRVPLGLEWTPLQATLGIFLEIVPGLSLVPSTSGFIQGGLGIRYYLK